MSDISCLTLSGGRGAAHVTDADMCMPRLYRLNQKSGKKLKFCRLWYRRSGLLFFFCVVFALLYVACAFRSGLSEGQWQRLMLSRFLMRADVAKLLVLDEPFKGISPAQSSSMMAALGVQARATGQVRLEFLLSCWFAIGIGGSRSVSDRRGSARLNHAINSRLPPTHRLTVTCPSIPLWHCYLSSLFFLVYFIAFTCFAPRVSVKRRGVDRTTRYETCL